MLVFHHSLCPASLSMSTNFPVDLSIPVPLAEHIGSYNQTPASISYLLLAQALFAGHSSSLTQQALPYLLAFR